MEIGELVSLWPSSWCAPLPEIQVARSTAVPCSFFLLRFSFPFPFFFCRSFSFSPFLFVLAFPFCFLWHLFRLFFSLACSPWRILFFFCLGATPHPTCLSLQVWVWLPLRAVFFLAFLLSCFFFFSFFPFSLSILDVVPFLVRIMLSPRFRFLLRLV